MTQQPQNKLSEIIWEITGRCENKCDYCGSKEVWNEEIDDSKIGKITKKITEYLYGGEINISGGDPLLIPYIIHQGIINKLKNNNNKVKIIVNPKSFGDSKGIAKPDRVNELTKLFGLYDVVGISVNSIEELTKLKDFNMLVNLDKTTIITNFNIFNVWEYDLIEEFINKAKLTWQIQYTMSSNKGTTIYNNNSAKKFLFEKITKSLEKNIKLILADNINSGKCGAGKSSLGILSNGDIIPCLSMRSWCNIDKVCQGNILDESLKDIWENKFKNYRFGEFECCKDLCNAPYDTTQKSLSFLLGEKEDKLPTIYPPSPPFIPNSPQTMRTLLYGVQTYPTKFDLKDDTIFAAYAVYTQNLKPSDFQIIGDTYVPPIG